MARDGNIREKINSAQTRGIAKTSGFTRAFAKIGDLIKFNGFFVTFCGILREQALLRKLKPPRKSPKKWTFLSLAFYNPPSLHLHSVKKQQKKQN